MRLLDRIGLAFVKPNRAFELIAVDNSWGESIVVLGLFSLSLFSWHYYSSEVLMDSIVSLLTSLLVWHVFLIVMSYMAEAIYRVPRDTARFYRTAVFSTISSISIVLGIIVSTIISHYWYNASLDIIKSIFNLVFVLWLMILLYYATHAVYRLDKKQFIVLALVSIVIVGLIVAGMALIGYLVVRYV